MREENRATDRARALVRGVLSHADHLGLDNQQIAGLNRIYWAAEGQLSAPDTLSNVESLLSREQFLSAVCRYAMQEDVPNQASESPLEIIQAMVTDVLTEKTKDKSLIEVELATKVADRLIAWSKVFGFFVAAPVAVLLLVLSMFGFSKFDDVRQAAKQADTLVQQAQSRLSEASDKIRAAERQIADVTVRANERSKEIDTQLAELKAMSDKNSNRISSLDQAVKQIENQLGSISRSSNNPNITFRQKIDEGWFDKYYGPWGMSQNIAKKFVHSPEFPWRDQFANLEPDTDQFEAVWKNVAPNESGRFLEMQRNFIQVNLYEPTAKSIFEQFGLDLSKRSQALRDAVFISVSHPDLTGDPLEACKKLRASGKWRPSDPDFDEVLIRSILASDTMSLEQALRQIRTEKEK